MPKTVLEKGLLETMILRELRDICADAISVTVVPVNDPVADRTWVCKQFEIRSGDTVACRDVLRGIVAKLQRVYDLKRHLDHFLENNRFSRSIFEFDDGQMRLYDLKADGLANDQKDKWANLLLSARMQTRRW